MEKTKNPKFNVGDVCFVKTHDELYCMIHPVSKEYFCIVTHLNSEDLSNCTAELQVPTARFRNWLLKHGAIYCPAAGYPAPPSVKKKSADVPSPDQENS